ncbi:glycosyltransferase family 2 protein [Pseudomonas kurunegalensis]|uniref:glycosyltransferase family 2 protein n=1 Tax=Pseudomonas kurunegalensis TaxID=485880 RepID=UPI0025709E68|nr:glycosyltransferase family 2 protein [Pseudomonas kurunegalensis]WJD64030.1 glycosyltransferase family 2 protein [Pseudomonas kurunegalensis]
MIGKKGRPSGRPFFVLVFDLELSKGSIGIRIIEWAHHVSAPLKRPAYDCEMIFINGGSTDNTQKIIKSLAREDPRVSGISLSRNFGKEAAMTAGLDYAKGDAVAVFDVDLQDQPSLLISFVEEWEKGFDVVYAKRTHRDGESWLKKVTASLFGGRPLYDQQKSGAAGIADFCRESPGHNVGGLVCSADGSVVCIVRALHLSGGGKIHKSIKELAVATRVGLVVFDIGYTFQRNGNDFARASASTCLL